ncbi:cyanamide hydratase, partial [Tremellales sp. Uapishka_1]
MTSPDYGLTALPAAVSSLRPSNPHPQPVAASVLLPPDTMLAHRIHDYAQLHLPRPTYLHSMRVYAYGLAIAQQCFPEWGVHTGASLKETWFLTAMLHDIGTTEANLSNTKLSYEFFAGVLALELLQRPNHGEEGAATATKEQAESVAEAIFRHQDVQDKGMVSLMTQLIQLGTLLDNVGAEVPSRWVARQTIDAVNGKWSRAGWCGCFRDTVAQEKTLKPYAMVSRIEGFEDAIMANRITGDGRGN